MNKTLSQLLELEAELKKVTVPCSIRAKILCSNLDEMTKTAEDLKLHLYQPFELSELFPHYHFEYRVPNTSHVITVNDTEEFRFEKKLVAI